MSQRIMYLRDNNNPHGKGNPIGCLAIEINNAFASNDQAEVFYQISACNPKDEFIRTTARKKAIGRLVSEPISVGLINNDCVSIHEITTIVMSNLAKNVKMPTRLRRSAVRWLESSAKIQGTKEIENPISPLFSLASLTRGI